MKTNILLLLCVILLPLTGKSQDLSGKVITSGKITYQEKAKLEIKLEGDAAQFGDKLPKEQVSGKVLYFNPDYSLYQADASKNEDDAYGAAIGRYENQNGNGRRKAIKRFVILKTIGRLSKKIS